MRGRPDMMTGAIAAGLATLLLHRPVALAAQSGPAPQPPILVPFDAKAYPPPPALPAGLRPVTFENRAGVRWLCTGARDCLPAPAAFAGWFGALGADRRTVRVLVRVLAPQAALDDREWATKVRSQSGENAGDVLVARNLAKGTLRAWRGPHGRVVESETRFGGAKLDRMWRLSRYEERPGWTLQLQITFWGLPDDAMRAALRAAFVDTQLGPTPPSAQVIPRR